MCHVYSWYLQYYYYNNATFLCEQVHQVGRMTTLSKLLKSYQYIYIDVLTADLRNVRYFNNSTALVWQVFVLHLDIDIEF